MVFVGKQGKKAVVVMARDSGYEVLLESESRENRRKQWGVGT